MVARFPELIIQTLYFDYCEIRFLHRDLRVLQKAILECETEWSTNKKLVDLGGRDVRKAVPKGLPYFAVDFGMQSGFAHVIEDEKEFPNNFAQVSKLQNISLCKTIILLLLMNDCFKTTLVYW